RVQRGGDAAPGRRRAAASEGLRDRPALGPARRRRRGALPRPPRRRPGGDRARPGRRARRGVRRRAPPAPRGHHLRPRPGRNLMSDVLRDGLARTLDATHFDGLGVRYEGKVRDNYTTPDGRRILVATDRLSTFDVVVGTIPYKGQVLNQLAAHWFEETAAIAPNHVIAVPDPNVTIAHECEPLKAEFIMRAYLTGVTTTSIWYAYERGARRFCGHALADGMKKNQKLARPILTPSTKADKGDHDVSVSREELLAMGAVSAEDFDAGA